MFDDLSPTPETLTMASYEESLSCIVKEAPAPGEQMETIEGAIGHVLAKDIIAPISVPSFDNSAMDGFAFSSACVEKASSERPAVLPVVGASIAGDTAGLSHLKPGFAAKIMTGAPVPEGADTVLPVERASWDHEKLTFYEKYPVGKHVRRVGEDVEKGDIVIKAGTRISSQHVPLMCALGLSRIAIYKSPRLAWITTGQEISDDFSEPLEPGHIYNATGLYGKSVLENLDLILDAAVTVRDTPQDFAGALEKALSGPAQVILSTGGVSAGQYDFVRPVLEDYGARIIVHKARIKPGKPILFAKLPGGKFFFGLPGNPISTALGLRVFVYPFIRALTGLGREKVCKAVLAKECITSGGRTVFQMAHVESNAQGQLCAVPHVMQQSFQTRPFAASNAWLISPEECTRHSAGDLMFWIPTAPPVC